MILRNYTIIYPLIQNTRMIKQENKNALVLHYYVIRPVMCTNETF